MVKKHLFTHYLSINRQIDINWIIIIISSSSSIPSWTSWRFNRNISRELLFITQNCSLHYFVKGRIAFHNEIKVTNQRFCYSCCSSADPMMKLYVQNAEIQKAKVSVIQLLVYFSDKLWYR